MAPRLVTFDVYTALFDYQGSLLRAVRAACAERADAEALLRAWRTKQLEGAQLSNSLGGERIAFRDLTRMALNHTFARAGVALTPEHTESLVAAWDTLRPWPEAEAVLAELKSRGHALGLLSNGDEPMLRALAGRLATPVDHVFASDRAGTYKPHPAIYGLPAKELGAAAASRLLHVAGSANDVLGAKRAGIACAWSNRGGDLLFDPRFPPDHEMRDLRGLLDIL